MELRNEEKIRLDKVFTPRPYQKAIFDAIENKGYKRAVLCWARRCMHGDTHITMSDGSFKLLKDIKPGDSILSWNGSLFEEDIVINAWKTEKKQTLKINSKAWPMVVASEDHLFAVNNQGYEVSWRKASELKLSQQLQLYGGIECGRLHYPDLAEFIGYMITDGYVSGYQQPKFTNVNMVILKRVEELALKLFGIVAIWRGKGKGYDLGLSNGSKGGGNTPNKIKELFRDYGLDIPKNIRPIHPLIWQFDRESVGRFISAVISCDGSIYTHDQSCIIDRKHRRRSIIKPYSEISISCGKCHAYGWGMYWLLRKIGIQSHVPKLERNGSNFKLSIGRHDQIKTLLSYGPIYGKEDKQRIALDIVKHRELKPHRLYGGCYRSRIDKIRLGSMEELYDIQTEKNHNFIANGYVVHNSGKDITLWHLMLRQALKRVGTYMYCLPTYSQAKSVIWESIRIDGVRFKDMIPPELVYKMNESTMSIELINHSIIKLIGSDSYNTSLRGSNPVGIVFSEYAQADPEAFKASLAIAQANKGFIIVQSTPWGHNGFYDLWEIAKNNPKEWFTQHLTISDTGHITRQQVEQDIACGLISREFANQEYYCDFNLGVEGSYYAKYLVKMRLNNQIGTIPYESHYRTNTCWDLGVRDSTFILWYQCCGNTIHIIDCLEDSKKGLEYYAKEVLSRDYLYNAHVAPHDIKVQEFGSGATRYEIAHRLGIDFTICDNVSIMDGIESVRCNLSKIYIDEVKCKKLISCLENYSQEYDTKLKIYKSAPRHDSYSHGADCLRYLTLSLDKIRIDTTAEQLDERYRKAMKGEAVNFGPFSQRS